MFTFSHVLTVPAVPVAVLPVMATVLLPIATEPTDPVAVAHGPALTAVTATGSVGSVAHSRTLALTGNTATGTAGTVRTWANIDTAETANWTDVLNTVTYEDCGAFSGGAIAATTISGNIITLSRPDLPVTWSNVDATETTTWYPIAA